MLSDSELFRLASKLSQFHLHCSSDTTDQRLPLQQRSQSQQQFLQLTTFGCNYLDHITTVSDNAACRGEPKITDDQEFHSNYLNEVINSSDLDDLEEWKDLLKRPEPPEGYICFNCYQPGHFIHHCTKELPAEYKLTPYQGSKPCVGDFKCQNCKRVWYSRRSMANLAQRCRRCRQWVYPRKQYAEEVALKRGVFEKHVYKAVTRDGNWFQKGDLNDSYSSSFHSEPSNDSCPLAWSWSE